MSRLFQANIQAVEDDLVLVIKDIAHQLVVHVQPVKKVIAGEERVAQFLAQFGLQILDARAQLFFLDAVAYDKNIERALPLADKNAGDDNELDAARFAHSLVDVRAALGSVQQQALQSGQISKIGVQQIARAAAP